MNKLIILILMIMVIYVYNVSAITKSWQPSAVNGTDTHIDSSTPNTNYGGVTYSNLGTHSSANYLRDMFNWNHTLASLPGSITIIDVNLSVHVTTKTGDGGTPFTIHPMNFTWGEGTVTWANCATGSGCVGGYNASRDILNSHTTITAGQWLHFNISKDWFQQLVDGTLETNFGKGFIMIGDEPNLNNRINFKPSDHATAATRPILTVTYEIGGDVTPPTITQINCTSNPEGDITEPYNCTGDLTPTFQLDLDESSTCGISNSNDTFTQGTTGTSSIVTLPFSQVLSCGPDQFVFFNCTDAAGNSKYNRSEVWACDAEAGEGAGDTVEVWQYIELNNFSNTELWWNRSVCAANFHAEEKSLDIPALPGWTLIQGADPLNISGQSTNCTVYQNKTFRPMFDEIINIEEVNLTNNLTETFNIGNLIDPPHAFTKDGIADCSLNTTISTNIDINHTILWFGNGIFNINAQFLMDGFNKNDTLCEVAIGNGGEIAIS